MRVLLDEEKQIILLCGCDGGFSLLLLLVGSRRSNKTSKAMLCEYSQKQRIMHRPKTMSMHLVVKWPLEQQQQEEEDEVVLSVVLKEKVFSTFNLLLPLLL